MIGQIAIAIPFPGFNDFGRLVTPIFLSMDHFLCQFSTFSKKVKKIYRSTVYIFANAPSNSVLLSSSLICAVVSNVGTLRIHGGEDDA